MTEVINTWNQLVKAYKAGLLPKKHTLAISRGEYRTVQVWSPFFKTNDSSDNAWYNHGKKAFHGVSTAKRSAYQNALEEAKEWVRTTYAYEGMWKGNSMRDQVPVIAHKHFPLRKTPK